MKFEFKKTLINYYNWWILMFLLFEKTHEWFLKDLKMT
jgi:hypothetical protein